MAGGIRQPFTPDEKQLLARFLAKRPSHDRTAPSVYAQFIRENPNTVHTQAAWNDHYKKSGREDIERRISLIKRDQKRARIAAAAQVAEAEVDGSNSKDKGKKRAREPSTESDELDSSDDGSQSETSSDDQPERKRKKRVPFNDKDFDLLVKYMMLSDQKDWTKARLFQELSWKNSDHTESSWQSYHRDNRKRAEKAVAKFRKAQRRKERRRDDSSEEEEDEEERREKKRLKAKKKEKAERRQSSSPRKTVPQTSESEADPEPARTKSNLVAEAVVRSPSRPAKKPTSTSTTASNVASSSKVQLPVSKAVQRAAAHASSSVEPAEGLGEFSDSDVNLLVHRLARVDVDDGSKADAFQFLSIKHPQHTYDQWRAYYRSQRAELDPLITAKVLEVVQARERKRVREEEQGGQHAVASASKGKGKQVVSEEEQVEPVIEQTPEEEEEVQPQPQPQMIVIETSAEEEEREVDEADQEDELKDDSQFLPALNISQTQVQAQDPSPPTPQPTPPSQHSQPHLAAPPAPAHESNSTGEEPSTQSDGVVAPAAVNSQQHVNGMDVDDKEEAEEEADEVKPRVDEREWSLPSPYLKADQYGVPPGLDDDAASLDEDDRRMEALLADDEQQQPAPPMVFDLQALDAGWGWQPLPAEQEMLVRGMYELEARLAQEQAQREAEAEVARVEAEQRKLEAQEQARREIAEKARREQRALEIKMAEEEAERKRLEEQEERRRIEKAERRRIEEEERKRVAEEKQAAELRRAEAERQAAAEEEKREKKDKAARRAAAAERKEKEEQVAREAEAKKKQAVKAGKQRASSSVPRPTESTPVPAKLQHPPPRPPADLTPLPKVASVPSSTDRKPVVAPSKRAKGTSVEVVDKKPRASSSAIPDPGAVTQFDEADPTDLKVILRARRDRFRLPKKGEFALYAACCCPLDLTVFDQACKWFSPTQRPDEGTAEYNELKRVVRIKVWSYNEDVVVLSGTQQAKDKLDKQKGRNAVNTRRLFLADLRKVQVSDLDRGWPWFN